MPGERVSPLVVIAGVLVGTAVGLAALLLLLPYLRPAPPAETSPSIGVPQGQLAGTETPPSVGGVGGLQAPGEQLPGTATPPTIGAPGGPPPNAETPPRIGGPGGHLSGLQTLLEEEAARMPGRVAVHVRVDGGGEAGVRAGAPMPAASVIKLPLMAAVQDAWRRGAVRRRAEDALHMRRMITVSDNPAADALIDRMGIARVNAWLGAAGYEGTRLRRKLRGLPRKDPNTVTAAEMTRMLLEIARRELVDPEAAAEMRRILLDQTRRTRIPAGLPEGTAVGNKTGTWYGIVNDVAFVEPPRGPRYAIAVLIEDAGGEVEASRAIARLSREVFRYLTARPKRD